MEGVKTTFGATGYWAIILGGSSGIGLATAKKLAQEGMNICVLHRDGRVRMKALEAEFEQIRNCGVQLLTFNKDASQPEAIDEVVQELKSQMQPHEKVRLLLHSVARGNLKPLRAAEGEPVLSVQDFQLTIDSMALNWFAWASAIRTAGMFAPDARLLALTSEGNQKAWKGYAAVSAAKVALEALCRSMALEFAPDGIRCNVIQAGVTDTPSLRMIPGSDDIIALATKRNPHKRLTTPEDVAGVIYLLCCDEAAWINGAIIPADGGERIA